MVSQPPGTPPDRAPPALPPGSTVASQTAPVQQPVPESRPDGVWGRIKRHKVAEWTLAYIAFAYALLHGTEMLAEALDWPHMAVRLVTLVLIAGVPVTVLLAWYHGHRAQQRMSLPEASLLIVLLVIAGSLLWYFSRRHYEGASAPVVNATPATIPSSAAPIPAFSPPPHSVAVLPFTNLSGDAKQAYFSDGLAEEMINALAHINELEVAARTSSFSFRGQSVDIPTIARKLNVGAILEGSVRRSGNKVRITAQLINAVSGFHMWSEDYDRELKDVLSLEAEIATAVAQQLQATLLGDEAARIITGGTRNPEAYDAYLRGVQLQNTFDLFAEGGWREALAAFDHAISLDPGFAAAYSRRAVAQITIAQATNDLTVREAMRTAARQSAERAIELAPELADAHANLGEVVRVGAFEDVDPTPEFKRAVDLAPGEARVQGLYGIDQAARGHTEPALAAFHRAIQLDPRDFRLRSWYVWNLWGLRRYDEALAEIPEARTLRPDTHEFDSLESDIDLARHQADRARQRCEADAPNHHECLALAYHALGRLAAAQQELDELKAEPDPDSNALTIAGIYAQWGDHPSALRWLSMAERLHSPQIGLVSEFWEFDPLGNEPEFQVLLRRLHLTR